MSKTIEGKRIVILPALVASLLVVASIMLFGLSSPAHASTTFTVNSTNGLGSGTCDASECTLEEAIAAANGNPGPDTINFNIPGTGVHTIKPTSNLPGITDPVTIDGYTQPGASPNTLAQGTNSQLKIELDGSNAGSSASGLSINAGGSGSVIRGLVINRFASDGIRVQDSSQNRIEGNFIGTDPSGTIDLGNGGNGVDILAINPSTSNTVGAPRPISATSSRATISKAFKFPSTARTSTGWRATS